MPIKPELRHYYPIDWPQVSSWVRFVRASSDRLWISSRSLPFGILGLRLRMQRTTAKYVGVRLWPHLLRDCLVTHLVIEDPEHVRIATGA